MSGCDSSPTLRTPPRIALMLAGGGARRMGGTDKGALILHGRMLAEHVLSRLAPQSDVVLISGPHDYGSGCVTLADREDGPRGPAAGLWAALYWIEENQPQALGFYTAPVDGPFVPDDLAARLVAPDHSAIACSAIASSKSGPHPTFAYWRCADLRAALTAYASKGLALFELADSVGAHRVLFEEDEAFFNINTSEDLARAEKKLAG